MPIAKKTLTSLATLLKIDVAKLVAAAAAEAETEVEIPADLNVFTKTELETRDENNKTAGITDKKEEFITAGKEIAAKEIKAKFGITNASKDLGVILGEVQTKITGDDAAKDQVTLLTADKAKLEKANAKLEKQLQDKELSVARIGKLPANINTDVLTIDEHLNLVNSKLEFTTDGIKLDGQVLRTEKDRALMTEKQAIEHFYTSQRPALLKAKEDAGGTGGRGGGDDNPTGGGKGKYKTLGDWRVDWEKRNPGKNYTSIAAQDELKEYVKTDPDMEMVDNID